VNEMAQMLAEIRGLRTGQNQIIEAIHVIRLLLAKHGDIMAQIDTDIAALQTAVAAETTATQSAITLISGIQAQIQNAVDAALAAGATPAELSSITDLTTTLQAQTSALSSAVTENTPAPAPVATAPTPAPATPPAPATSPTP
jgi:hypothetical protein